MSEKDQEHSRFDTIRGDEAKPLEQSTERLRAVTPKILHIAELLNYNGSPHERIVCRLLMAAVEAAHADTDQNNTYRSEALHAAYLSIQQAGRELKGLH